MDTKETVTITKEEYEDLLDAAFELQCLQGAGVDNWEGYDYAMQEYRKGDCE